MYLLILQVDVDSKTATISFTFHNVSINSHHASPHIPASNLHLHSTMYLLIRGDPLHEYEKHTDIYIPQCIY